MTVNLTFDIADILGTDFDSRRTKVWLETNIEGDVIIDATGNTIRLGHARATINTDGTGSFTGLPATNGATNPTAFQYQVHIDYPDRDAHNGRGSWASGWFPLTASDDLADVAAEAYVPPTWVSTFTASMDAIRDDARDAANDAAASASAAHDISGIDTSDGVVDALLANPASDSSVRLSATYVPQAGIFLPIPNGTDDTAAITAAIAAASTGQRLIARAGTYKASAIVVNKALTLDFTGATITQLASTNADLLTLSVAGAAVRGGTWDGNKANQSTDNSGIRITADDCTVSELTVTGTKWCGIYALNCNRPTIDRVTATDTGYIAIFVETNTSTKVAPRITRCHVDRSMIAAASILEGAIKVHGTSGSVQITDALIDSCRVLMPTSPTDATAICIETTYAPRAVVSRNRTSGGAMGISCAACDNNNVGGNTVYNAATYGIEQAGSRHSVTQGNAIDGNGLTSRAIMLDTGGGNNSDFSTVSANTLKGYVSRAINVQSALACAIGGNTCKGGNNYIINISGGTQHVIAGNVLDGNSTALKGIMIDSASFNTVTGNNILNCSQNGILLFSSTASYVIQFHTITANILAAVGAQVATQVSGGASVHATSNIVRSNPGVTDATLT